MWGLRSHDMSILVDQRVRWLSHGMSCGLSLSSVALLHRAFCAYGVVTCSVEHGQDWWYFLCEFLADRSQDDVARVRRGFQECGADGLFEVVDLTSEGGLSDAEVFGGLLRLGCRVRFAGGPLSVRG